MKKVPRILLDFKGKSIPKTVTKALIIYSGMDGNGNFTGITPTIASLNSAILAFQAAIGAAANGGKAAKEMRDQIKEALVSLLLELAAAVLDMAKGDRAILETSGFTISKDTFSPRVMGAIVDFLVALGKVSGTVKCSCSGVKHKVQYMFQYARTPITDATFWIEVSSPKRICIIPGLDSMKEYAFRLKVIGPNGQKAYSEVITKIVP